MGNIDDAKDAVRRELVALNAQDVEGVLSFYTDDVVFVDVSLPQPIVGKAAMREFMQGLYAAFPDAHVEPITIFGEGSHVAAEYELIGTHLGSIERETPTAKTFRVPAVSVYEYDGALFTRETFYWDSASMRSQLGLTGS
jgi:steroid delta-isomerase-like uncharacterized protein